MKALTENSSKWCIVLQVDPYNHARTSFTCKVAVCSHDSIHLQQGEQNCTLTSDLRSRYPRNDWSVAPLQDN